MDADDEIVGGAGTDTLIVRMAAQDALGVITDVENIVIIARGIGEASFVDVSGAENVTLRNGTTDYGLTAFNQSVDLTFENSDDEYTVSYADLGDATDTQVLTVDGYEGNFVIGTTGLETLAIIGANNASDFEVTDAGVATIETITIAGSADVELTLDVTTDAVETIDASAATGDVTVTLAAVGDITVTGGDGDDTFVFGTTLNSNDNIDGGDGDDTLVATVATAGTLRATATNVESLDLSFTAAGTFDARNITGATSLELSNIDEAVTVTRLASTVTSLLLTDGVVGTDAISVTYAANSDSDVTLTVGASNDDEDAVASLGNITIVGNEGALVINSEGDDDNDVNAVVADDAISLTINANVNGLTTTTVSAAAAEFVTINATAGDVTTTTIGAADATDFTLNATGGDIEITDATLTDATTIALNAIGGAISTGVLTTAADAAEITVEADGDNDNDVTITLIDADFATSFSFTATDGADITVTDIETLGEDSDGDDIDNEINLTATGVDGDDNGSVVSVSIDAFAAAGVVDLVTMVSDEDGDVQFTIGAGTSITITEVDATGSAGATTIDLSGLTVASEVSTGTGGSTTTLTSAADTFIGGSGDDELAASDGADDITLGAGDDTVTIGFDGNPTIQDFAVADDAIIIDNSILLADALGTAGVDIGGGVIGVEDGVLHFFSDGAILSDLTANILVMDTVTFANNAALATAIEAGGAQVLTLDVANLDVFLAIYTDGADAFIVTITNEETDNDTDLEAGDAIIETIATLIGVNDLTTLTDANFSFIA